MDVTTLYDILEPHVIRTITSGRITLSVSGAGSGLEQHSLFGTYHTGQLDESQALWVDPKIINRIADHSSQADVHHPRKHNILDTTHHEVTDGLAFDVIGQSAPNVLARLTPSSNPGAAASILRTASDGLLTLQTLNVTTSITAGTKVTMPRIEAPADLTIAPFGDVMFGPTGGQVRMLSSTDLQSDNFQSQIAGWRMTYGGELDARYITADQLKVKLFIADITQALAGSEIITKSVSTLAQDFRIPFPGDSAFIYIDDLPSAENMAFAEAGDFIRIREFNRTLGSLNVTDSWGTISSYADQANKVQRWTFTRSGTNSGVNIAQVGTRRVANTTGTSSTVTKVTGTANGHTMFAFVVLNRQTTVTPPSGFTELYSTNVSTGKVFLYRKVAGASEPANYTFTFGTTGENMASLYCYSNVQTTGSFYTDFKVSIQNDFAASVLQGQSVWSASSQGDMVLLFAGMVGNHIGGAPPDGMTEQSDQHWNGIGTYMAEWKQEGSGDVGEMIGALDADAYSATITLNLLPTHTLSLTTGFLTPGTRIAAEAFVLDYGVSGNGWIESTTVDGAYGSNSPYTQVVSWTTHPATGAVVRTRSGHLRGLFGIANEYGFYAGNGVANSSSYIRLSSNAIHLNNVPIQLWNTGQQKVNIDAEGIDIWVGNGSGDKRLSWDGSNLSVKGSVTISDVSGFSGSGYLKIGTGTKDSTLSGWQFDAAEIVGQASGVDQVVMNTSGKILAGGGDVTLDADGIKIKASTSYNFKNSLSFVNGSGNEEARMFVANAAFATNLNIAAVASGSNRDATVNIDATPSGAGIGQINLSVPSAGGTINLTATQQITLNGPSAVIGSLDISPTGEFQLDVGGLSIGRRDVDYSPTTTNWSTAGTTLLLTGQNYSVIGFHDADTRVDFIRVGAGTMTLGYDGGWGAAQVLFGGIVGSGWTGLSFNSGWTNYDAGWIQGGYKKVGDLIFLRGLVKRVSGADLTVGVLPAGFRPTNSHMITAWSDAGVARIDINSSGQITLISGGVGWVSLFSVVFSTL